MRLKTDVVIIGAGILGAILARMCAESGLSTLVVRLSDLVVPQADTLRNQGLLQTGLRYHSADKLLAELMRVWGRQMHRYLGQEEPSGKGIFQVAEKQQAASLVSSAKELGLEIRELEPEEALELLGPFYDSKAIAFQTPETTFDEPLLLDEARLIAKSAGAQFRELTRPAELVARRGETPSHLVLLDGTEVEARVTVLAAGAGNVPLVRTLDPAMLFSITQTPLAVIRETPLIASPLLINRPSRSMPSGGYAFSVVAHPDANCMVVGADEHIEVPWCEPSERKVSEEQRDRFFAKLPPILRNLREQSRITAGWEIARVIDGTPEPTAKPWVDTISGHSDVLVASPGRATLALYAAEMVFKRIQDYLKAQGSRVTSVFGAAALPGTPWRHRERMHHDVHYNGMNDI